TQFPSNPISRSITDDHVAFVNIGIPSADLIINFWNDQNWDYHHTTEDNINNIDKYSLEITGRTVEQFIYNNYLNNSTEMAIGNFPWNFDKDQTTVDIIMIFILVITIGAISILFINILKFNPTKNGSERNE
ncbi:MAG TPA: M28 family peptidase, partial [bacterium]|nr:M28 family peptidase [bacterium]